MGSVHQQVRLPVCLKITDTDNHTAKSAVAIEYAPDTMPMIHSALLSCLRSKVTPGSSVLDHRSQPVLHTARCWWGKCIHAMQVLMPIDMLDLLVADGV